MSSTSTGGILKNEPVIVAHFVAWLLLQAGLIVVGRFHIVSDTTWSALSSALAPVITGALMAALAWVIRHVVTPAWKAVEGILPDAPAAVVNANTGALLAVPVDDKATADTLASWDAIHPSTPSEGA